MVSTLAEELDFKNAARRSILPDRVTYSGSDGELQSLLSQFGSYGSHSLVGGV